jgi:hypothetical protein
VKKIFGGLMKKSLLFGIPLALIALAFFAGCSQSAEEDETPPPQNVGAYETTPEGIAIAFADGQEKVYLWSDLALGNEEVVIPVRGVLDLSNGATINNMTAGGKLIVAGNITFSEDNAHDILFYRYPETYLITTQTFYNTNVEVIQRDSTGNVITSDKTKHIKIDSGQALIISENFNILSDAAWAAVVQQNSNYIPIGYTGTIGENEAAKINAWASGHKLYIIGDVTITDEINLKDTFVAPAGNTSGALFNAGLTDNDGSLVVAGNVLMTGPKAAVSTINGFSVFGKLVSDDARGDNAFINKAGPLVAYYVNVPSGAVTFNGPVTLIGSMPSDLYTNANIIGDFKAPRAKIKLTGVSVSGGGTLSAKGFEFKENSTNAQIKIENSGAIQVVEADPTDVTTQKLLFTGANVDPMAINNFIIPSNAVFSYQSPVTEPPSTGSYSHNVEFNAAVEFNKATTPGGTVTFAKGVVFYSTVKFGEGVTGTFSSTDPVTFSRSVEFTDAIWSNPASPVPGFGGTVTFNGSAKIDQANVGFSADTVFKNGVSLPKGGSFTGNVTLESGEFILPLGKPVYFSNTGYLLSPGGGIKISGDSGYGSLVAPTGSTMKFGGNVLSIKNGALDAAGIKIALTGDGKIEIDSSGASAPVGILTNGKISGSKNYTLQGGISDEGVLTLLQGSGGLVTLASDGFTGNGGGDIRPSLILTSGTEATALGPTANLIVDTNGINIKGLTVELYKGDSSGTLSLAPTGTSSIPVIVLQGGVGGAAGAILYGPNSYIIGGDVLSGSDTNNTATAVHNTGYIVANAAGTFVQGTSNGDLYYNTNTDPATFVGSMAFIAQPNVEGNQLIIGSGSALNGFAAVNYVGVSGADEVKAIAKSENASITLSRGIFSGTDAAAIGGSIAVFSQN